MDNSPLFEITVSPGNTSLPKSITVPNDNSDISWSLLLLLNGNTYMFDFSKSQFISISYQQYKELKQKTRNITISGNQNRDTVWYELPLNIPHPKREDNSEVIRKKKIRRRSNIDLEGSTYSVIKQYNETEKLLHNLIEEDF